MNYTNRVKAAMALKGYNQKYMAEMLGIAINTFNMKLNRTVHKKSNKENIFSIDEALKIALLLDVTLDEIFFNKGCGIMSQYIKSVSFSIGNKPITSDQAKEIMNKRIYKIDKGDTKDESNDNSLYSSSPTV